MGGGQSHPPNYKLSAKFMAKRLTQKVPIIKETKAPEKSGKSIVWLKIKAYISDKERLDAGVYKMSSVPERLQKLSSNYCEIFNGGINSRKLAEMAKWAGITHQEDFANDSELLDRIITQSL